MKIIRVFPRRTSMTPRDDYAFVGDPPSKLIRPEADEVHVDCTFTWDIKKVLRLVEAWRQYYPVVQLGGAALGSPAGEFIPGLYVRHGVTITSRGCNNHCPWCLVYREGKLFEIPITEGNIVQDNNLLQCSKEHISEVFDMLRVQHGIRLSGGLDSRLLTDSIADDLRSLRIRELFFACDYKEALRPLEKARHKLEGFTRNQLRCYVLLAFDNETISQAQERLEAVWGLGFMPFAQLYQPPDRYIRYSREWQSLARTWSRPAAMKAYMKGDRNG